MKRRLQIPLLLMLIASGLWPKKGSAQPSASIQQYYYYDHGAVTFAPIVGYQFDKGLYFEGRYNYEDLKTYSMYVGKTFENDAAFTYSITPIAGAIFGTFKGFAAGANISFDYKRLSFSSNPQYTLSKAGRESNFLYSWSDLSFQLFKGFALGVSAQHTQYYQTKGFIEKGLFVEISFKRWSLPFYLFNAGSSSKYFMAGLTYEWEGRKHKKESSPQPAPVPQDSSSFILANQVKQKTYNKTETPQNQAMGVNKVNRQNELNTHKADVRPDPEGSLYALILGNYTSAEKAKLFKEKLSLAKGQKVMIISEGLNNYKIRMTGFVSRREAEAFREKCKTQAVQLQAKIQPYQIRSLEI